MVNRRLHQNFKDLGTPIIDSDVIARSLVTRGEPCLNAIINEFGEGILDNRGELDRTKLSTIIFNDSDGQKKVRRNTSSCNLPGDRERSL